VSNTTPTHVTLEPCVHNTDGSSLTAYFPQGTTKEQAEEWVRQANRNDFPLVPLWVDPNGEWFCVTETECPFPGFVRFQFDPCE